jgi:hypothetical protein
MMFRTASGLVEVTPFLRTGSGLVECGGMMFRAASGLVNTGTAKRITASANPVTAYGAAENPGAQQVLTNSVEAKPLNGTAPFTYAWARTNGDELFAASPTAAITAFRGFVGSGQTKTAAFRCTITDASGRTALTPEVEATVANYGNGNAQL